MDNNYGKANSTCPLALLKEALVNVYLSIYDICNIIF